MNTKKLAEIDQNLPNIEEIPKSNGPVIQKGLVIPLTHDDKILLANKTEEFLEDLFATDILIDDVDTAEVTKEESMIKYIIEILQRRISYY